MIYVELVIKFIAPHLDWTDRLLRLRWMVGLADRKIRENIPHISSKPATIRLRMAI